jgi:hypothetical protein
MAKVTEEGLRAQEELRDPGNESVQDRHEEHIRLRTVVADL